MKNKSTNFELLRIILTLFIPIYHWFLYNGVFYVSDEPNAINALWIFTGITFSCLYAFITMSSFFLLKKKYSWNAKKLYDFLALLLTLFVFKMVVINLLFPGYYMNYYVDSFFLKGAWWYVYPYILLMIFYPFLNRIIYKMPLKGLYIITGAFIVWLIINSLHNNTIMFNDCIIFLAVYFLMACNERRKEEATPFAFYQKHQKPILICIYILCCVCLAVLSLYFNSSKNHLGAEASAVALQKVHGRYNIFGFISGISLFTLFKDIKIAYTPMIHKISKITLFIFLLHETVMSVFWVFQIKSAEYLTFLPAHEFWGWVALYMILTILFAALMYFLYYTFVAPIWNKIITPINNSTFTKKIEALYEKLKENN